MASSFSKSKTLIPKLLSSTLGHYRRPHHHTLVLSSILGTIQRFGPALLTSRRFESIRAEPAENPHDLEVKP